MLYSYIFTFTALIFGLHFYKNRYPQEFDTILEQFLVSIQSSESLKPFLPYLTLICYNIIYIYSFCQVTLNKIIRYTIPYIREAANFIRSKIDNYYLCSNGNGTTTTNNNTLVFQCPELSIVKSEHNAMLILDKSPSNLDLDSIQCELSDLRFVGLYLKYKNGDTETDNIIHLFSSYMNFYVVGNVLNTNFFKYYLENVLKINIDTTKPFTYNLELIDHNLKEVNLDESQSIIIRKNDYQVMESNKMNMEVKNVVEEILEELEKINIEEFKEENKDDIKNDIKNDKNVDKNVFEPSTVIY
jgi:hypothetical protein